ncbi:MAG: PD40 domain-containing protein, partial [Calditrichaeota bacterium]|nr:PD40 domain-containing protein [Calditrichota bacterium]
GSKINSDAVDGSPCLSPDGRFLFLTSNRGSENVQRFDGKLDIFMIPFSPDKYR